jgi:hypothetical protein
LSDVSTSGEGTLWLERVESGWQVIAEPNPNDKNPRRGGSFKEAFRNRFLLVYGTGGTPDENAWMADRARFDAETFWYRGNGAVPIVADTDWKAVAETDRNVIVYGNASINAAWAELLNGTPIVVERGRWRSPGDAEREESAGAWIIRPRPASTIASVAAIGGTDLTAMRATNRVPLFSSGTGYPDALIVAPEYLQTGTAAVLLAGHFGVDWSFEQGDWVRRSPPPSP